MNYDKYIFIGCTQQSVFSYFMNIIITIVTAMYSKEVLDTSLAWKQSTVKLKREL